MAFFRTVSFSEPLPIVEGDGVFLRAPQMADYSEWATLREASRAFLTPWEPTWPSDDLSRSAFRRRLRRYAEDQRADQAYRVLPVPQERRGAGRRADARQYPPRRRAGRQPRLLDRRAVRAPRPDDRRRAGRWCRSRSDRCGCTGSKPPAFPSNTASIRLLEKAGFVREGYAREYLCINGLWQDHLLFARLNGGRTA